MSTFNFSGLGLPVFSITSSTLIEHPWHYVWGLINMGIHRLIHLFNKYFVSIYHVQGVVHVAGVICVKKTIRAPSFKDLTFQGKSWLAKSSGGENPNDSVPQNELSIFREWNTAVWDLIAHTLFF